METVKTVLLIFLLLSCSVGRESILIVRSSGQIFDQVVQGISYECDGDFVIDQLLVNDTSTVSTLAKKIDEIKPSVLVLLNNSAVLLLKQYQENNPSVQQIPSIAAMSVFVDKLVEQISNSAAIAYEIPLATSYMTLPSEIQQKISRVGVIHREKLQDFITKNRELSKPQNIELVSRTIPEATIGYKNSLYKSLREMLQNDSVDLIWIPNDSKLLELEMVQDVWLPLIDKYKKPVLAGVKVLALPSINLATFVVSPDHVEIGQQIAELIYEARDANWQLEYRVLPPVSVYKILNESHYKKTLNIELQDYNLFQEVIRE